MARSIILRFTAICATCQRALYPGQPAVWRSRGNVLCHTCHDGQVTIAPPPAPGSVAPAVLPPFSSSRCPCGAKATVTEAGQPFCVSCQQDARRAAAPAPSIVLGVDRMIRSAGPSPRLSELLEKAQTGLSSAELAELSATGSAAKLLVRLRSGARFVCAAYDAHRLCRALEESCMESVRDVLLAAAAGTQ